MTALIPLNGSNYSTWKIQCRMMLMKEGLWKIVTGEETEPNDEGQCGGLGVIRGRQRSGCKAAPILVVHSHHLSSRTVRQDLSSFLTAHLDE